MKKYTTTIFFVLGTILNSISQEKNQLRGFWKSEVEKSIFKYYNEKNEGIFVFIEEDGYVGGGMDPLSFYGFYKNCNPPHKDSLNMDMSGLYFEVPIDAGILYPTGTCPELTIFEDKGDTFLTFYYSSRQQWVTYKKMKKLPTKLEKFLKKEHMEVFKDYLHSINGREITTPKTYIYTAPNLKGKMYLLKGDIVTVLEEEKDFVKFEYETDKERIITGYLKKEDLE